VRIAVSSSTFRRPFAAAELTQLEWLERCASVLGADGVIAGLSDFPRRDAEYVAQLRKVAIDLGLVPFGLDAPGLLEPGADGGVAVAGRSGEGGAAGVRRSGDNALSWDAVFGLASGLGAAVVRTALPAPGEVPPATFVEVTGIAKRLSRAAKAANVTVLIAPAPGTLGADLDGVKHLLKDVDGAWLRACPSALIAEVGPKDRYPAFAATPADDPAAVAARASRSWLILDAAEAEDRPWDVLGRAITALRDAEARSRLVAG
jgi:hypothetical protein